MSNQVMYRELFWFNNRCSWDFRPGSAFVIRRASGDSFTESEAEAFVSGRTSEVTDFVRKEVHYVFTLEENESNLPSGVAI